MGIAPVSTKSCRRSYCCGTVLFCCWGFMPLAASSQSLISPDELDKSATQRELDRLSKADPTIVESVRNALKASQEEAGDAKRGKRSRRKNASRRIVNGLGTIGFPAAGALLHGADRKSAT